MRYLREYRRLSGVGPSLMQEAMEDDPMLRLLSTAFSTKVRPPDLKFIRYRKAKHGVELEDQAERLGGILTSIESREADPHEVITYLKKHGAKPLTDEEQAESLGEGYKSLDVLYGHLKDMERKGIAYLNKANGNGLPSSAKGLNRRSKSDGEVVQLWWASDADRKAGEKYLRGLDHKLMIQNDPRLSQVRVSIMESLDEQSYSVLGPGPKAGDDSDVAKFCADITKGVQSAVRGKFFYCRPSLKFGTGGAFIDYANIPATAKPGSLDFFNAKVQVRLFVDGFDAEGNLKGSKIKVEALTSPRGIKFRAKTGTMDQVVKHIVTTIKKAAEVTESSVSEADDSEQGGSDDAGWAARRHAIDFAGKSKGEIGQTILQQMGGVGRLRAMIGANTFIAHPDGISFKFPNQKSSRGNYVKVTLTPDDLYDMEFSKIVKYQAKPVKRYSGLTFDQLIPVFQKQTGLRLHL